MARTAIDTWNPDFLELSPIFNSIQEVCLPFAKLSKWPTLDQYSAELKHRNIQSHTALQIQAVEQGGAPGSLEDHYESRIYLKGQLQTRLENWHDFFNAMCWLQFPRIKSMLNALHYECSHSRQPGTNRGPLENAITLFDECGAIIVADDNSFIDSIRNHEWSSLFLENKEVFGRHVQCYVFGHALFEKSLKPYVGMTAHSILLKHSSEFFKKNYSEQLIELDRMVSDHWLNRLIINTSGLQPFPLLGIPGWWNKIQDENFYSNIGYFRKKVRLL